MLDKGITRSLQVDNSGGNMEEKEACGTGIAEKQLGDVLGILSLVFSFFSMRRGKG